MDRFLRLAGREFQTDGAMKVKECSRKDGITFRNFRKLLGRLSIGGCVMFDTCRRAKLKSEKGGVCCQSDGIQRLLLYVQQPLPFI